MTEGSIDLECPGCGYQTIVWAHDGHATLCPECGTDALVPEADAEALRTNRLEESGLFDRALNANKATDFIPVPEGSTEPDRVTMVDGEPLVEIPGYPTVQSRSESLLEQVETVDVRQVWDGVQDDRTSDLSAAMRVTDRAFHESVDLDQDTLQEVAEEVRRGSPRPMFRPDPLGDDDD